MEIGGRWAPQFVGFLRALSQFRAEDAPSRLRPVAKRWWFRRWTGMLAVAAQAPFAMSLCMDRLTLSPVTGGEAPPLSMLADAL